MVATATPLRAEQRSLRTIVQIEETISHKYSLDLKLPY